MVGRLAGAPLPGAGIAGPGARGGGLAALAPALALLLISTAAILAAAFAPTGAGGQYAVVAPPWYDLGRTIQLAGRAGGAVVEAGGLANVVIIHADDPRIVRALYAAGAWLVLDPGRLRGCLNFAASPTAAGGGA